MTNQVLQEHGTTLTWTSSGGDYALTLTSLADGNGRAGDEHDFGATWPARIRVELLVDFNAAPTAGKQILVWWASSDDGASYDGECAGADEAYNTESDTWRLHFVGALSASNDTDPQRQSWVLEVPARYGLPVVYNKSGQALTATGTDQVITVTANITEVQ